MRLDLAVYALLLRVVPDLGPYRADALDTYRDLRSDAASRGPMAITGLFLRSAGPALGAFFAAAWGVIRRLASPMPRPPQRGPRRLPGWPSLGQDLRLALRGIRQRPAFSLAIIGMLALGIGSTTAVFSLVDGVLLRSLPYERPDRLVVFTEGSHPGPLVDKWRQRLTSFDRLAVAWSGRSVDLTGDGPPVRLTAVSVSSEFLPLFGARTARGRLFTPDDNPADRVVVISSGLWQRRWAEDPDVIGRNVQFDGEAWTIVGVLAPSFEPPEALVDRQVDVWKPLDHQHEWLTDWGTHVLSVVGRLRPGIDQQVAQAEVDALAEVVAAEHPDRRLDNGQPQPTPLEPLHTVTTASARRPLVLLLGGVGLMLLIGCANVANLLLARGQDRYRELALRTALGASRARLVSQLLIDSMVLSVAGGLAGLGVAHLGIRGFALIAPASLPRGAAADLGIDPRAFGFAIALSVATGLLFGIAPAVQAARVRATRDLRGAATPGHGPTTVRGWLVIAEVAMALILLLGAGLFGHSLLNLLRTDPGFSPDGVVRLRIDLGEEFEVDSRLPFTRELIERIEAIPGAVHAAAGWTTPFDYTGRSRCCWRTRLTAPSGDTLPSIIHPVTPRYFETLGIPHRGDDLDWDAAATGPVPTVVDQVMAQRLFGDVSPLGQRFTFGRSNEAVVVGVVDGTRHYGLESSIDGAVYVPYSRFGTGVGELSVTARFATPFDAATADALRAAVWAVNPDMPIAELAALPDMISRSLGQPRFLLWLFGIFAGLAALLAASGIASSLLYNVGRRHREMGIRLAVGARGTDLVALVLRQSLVLTSVGLVIGLVGARWLGQYLESLIHGVAPNDPTTFAAVAASVLLIALAASYWPARIAARTDPATTLRAD